MQGSLPSTGRKGAMCRFASIAPDAPIKVIGADKHLFLLGNPKVFVTTTIDGLVVFNGKACTIMEATRKAGQTMSPSQCWTYKGMTLEMLNLFVYKTLYSQK